MVYLLFVCWLMIYVTKGDLSFSIQTKIPSIIENLLFLHLSCPFFLGNSHKANFEKERHSDNRDRPAPVLERINFDKRAIPESYCTWNAAAILLTKLEHQRRSLSKENAIEPSANSPLNILLELGVKHLTLKITNSFNESYKSTYS